MPFPRRSGEGHAYSNKTTYGQSRAAKLDEVNSIMCRHADLPYLLHAARELQRAGKQIYEETGHKWKSVQQLAKNKLSVETTLKLAAIWCQQGESCRSRNASATW
jgi:hypothetical protein